MDRKQYLADVNRNMRELRRLGAVEAEVEYYKAHGDGFNARRRSELYLELLRILGEKKQLLIEYADREMACFNPDTDYFYNRGFDDCMYFLHTLDRVGGRDFLIDCFFKNVPEV